MACKESICRNCFHSYVCEQFNENKNDNNEKCHFANDHYIPRTDVVPKSEVDKTIAEWAYLHADVLNKLEKAKADVAREIFEEISKASADWGCYCISSTKWGYVTHDVSRTLAELKKKYIGG